MARGLPAAVYGVKAANRSSINGIHEPIATAAAKEKSDHRSVLQTYASRQERAHAQSMTTEMTTGGVPTAVIAGHHGELRPRWRRWALRHQHVHLSRVVPRWGRMGYPVV